MRSYPQAILDQMDAGTDIIVGLLRVDLGEGVFGIRTGRAEMVFEGVTYKPIPDGAISVSALRRVTGSSAAGFTVTIQERVDSGVTPGVIAGFEAYDYMDRPVRIYDWHLDPDTLQPVGTPQLMQRGYITQARHKRTRRGGYRLVLECEDRSIDFARRNGRKRSSEDQARRAPGDTLWRNSALTGLRSIKWGRT